MGGQPGGVHHLSRQGGFAHLARTGQDLKEPARFSQPAKHRVMDVLADHNNLLRKLSKLAQNSAQAKSRSAGRL
jgi:hypothetical protein